MSIKMEDWKMSLSVAGGVLVPVLVLVNWLWGGRNGRNRYPDGPFSFPLLGNIPQIFLAGSLDKLIEKYRGQYGDVFSIEVGGNKRVVVCGYDNIHELLIKNADVTSTRSTAALPTEAAEISAKAPGLVWAKHPFWKTWRSITLKFMGEGGVGVPALESKINMEVDQFCQHYIEPEIGNLIQISATIEKATTNIITQLVFGVRRDYYDVEFGNLIGSVQLQFKSSAKAGLLQNIPLVRNFKPSGLEEAIVNVDKFRLHVAEQISEHHSTLDPNNPRDLIDMYLIHKEKEPTDNFNLGEGSALSLFTQQYVGGTDTLASVIRWALLYTCQYPKVKDRVQEEIDNYLGREREVVYEDRKSLPYTDAVILEVLRLANVVSTALPHTLEKELEINGKVIPSGADLLLSMTSVIHYDDAFDQPMRFNPDRYLSDDADRLKQRTIPFSIGPRSCLGENVVRTELFIFYVRMMQKYDMAVPDEDTKLSPPVSIFVNAPPPYRIRFAHRQPVPMPSD